MNRRLFLVLSGVTITAATGRGLAQSAARQTTVETTLGKVRGYVDESVSVFKGVWVGRSIAPRDVEELRQLEPEGRVGRSHEHRAEAGAVRIREVPDERIGTGLRRGTDRLGRRGRRSAGKRRSRELDSECRDRK